MPLPKPQSEETKKEWIERCMSDDVMNTEFTDAKQRVAICQQIWRDKEKREAPKRELRYMPFEGWEVRDGDDAPRLVGYAAVFRQEAQIADVWRERVEPGAYKKSIQESDIRALWNHNTDLVLGRTKSGTLHLTEDDHGLRVEIIPPATQAGRDAIVSIKRGDVSQMSIAFQIKKEEWVAPRRGELPLRIIHEARLFDVSPVTFPAFESTHIEARDLPSADLPIRALLLARYAALGHELTDEQQQIVVAARSLYKSVTEPDAGLTHPGTSTEPSREHHSADWREEEIQRQRRLDAIKTTL